MTPSLASVDEQFDRVFPPITPQEPLADMDQHEALEGICAQGENDEQ